MATTIRNPIEWGGDQLRRAAVHAESVGRSVRGADAGIAEAIPVVRRVEVSDLRDCLAKGFEDFTACRSDVIALCLIYPIVGLFLVWFTVDYALLPLLFPLASGFALLGPIAAVGLYEMSRQREAGIKPSWSSAFGMMASPSFGAIIMLGLMLLAIFLLWLVAAQVIYLVTLGPEAPASLAVFVQDVATSGAGWLMSLTGLAVGACFALAVLAISVVSFPLLLDRDVGLGLAISTSVRVVLRNPRTMILWGVIVAGGLLAGAIPLFLGLIVILPVLGHATWHLYRKAVEHEET